MNSFQDDVDEYKRQVTLGSIKKAYQGLMDYIMRLRTHFQNKYPDFFVSGSIYFGYMDMTYFSFSPDSLKRQGLKIAIVFIHDTCRFEAWLAGVNKQVQLKYWKLFKESQWNKYPVVSSTQGVDAIIETILVESPDFNDLDRLTDKIEKTILQFIEDIENFLSSFRD